MSINDNFGCGDGIETSNWSCISSNTRGAIMNNDQNKVMDQRETREDESQDWATLFAGFAA